MKQILAKIFFLLCITAFVFSTPTAWDTHDPTTGTYTQVAATSRDHPFQPKWFSTETKSTTDIRFVYGYMTAPSTKTISTLDLTAVTVSEYVVKAISQGLRCFILHKNTASGQQLNAYLYPISGTAAPTPRLIASAGNTTINPAAALPNDFSVNDDCTAFRYGALSFHWSGTAWVADTIAVAWTNPVFNNDHTIAISDDGIYTYASNVYTKNALVDTFHTNKKVYTTATKMVVYSWKAGTGNDDSNKVFKLQIYSIAGTTITAINNESGTSFTNQPGFTISENLQNIALYYKSTAPTNPYTFVGKVVNYVTNRAVNIQTHPFIREGQPQIYVGNRFLYAIRTVNVGGIKQHQPFILNGNKLVLYRAPLNYGATTYTRVLVQSAALNQLNVIYQRMNTDVYTLQRQILQSNLNIESFDINKQADGTTPRVLGSIVKQSQNGKLTWYTQGTITGSLKAFQYTAFIGGSLTRNQKQLADTYTTKAKSVGKSCLVLHDSAGTPKVQVWDLNTDNPSTTKKDITLKVTMANIGTTEFQITDDCGALRIGNRFYHWVPTGTADYYEDTVLPANTVPLKPIFSKDGKYMIANNGIFSHTPKDGATPGKLTLQRNDTFYDNKQIFIDTNFNLVIWSWAGSANSFLGKVQINFKAGTGLMKVMTQTGGPLFGQPKIAINQKFNRIVVWGATSASTFFYSGIFVNWGSKTFKPITLPEQVTSRSNVISISDDYLYARNAVLDAATGYRKHYVYNIQGNTLFRMIDQFVYPTYITSDNPRTFVSSDNDGKLLIVYEYFFNTQGIYRLVKDVRIKPTDITQAKRLPLFDLGFAYTTQTTPATDFFASSTTPFGRYVWLDSASKLNYLQYSPQTIPSKRITVTAATALATGYTIKASSPSKDCIIVRKATFLKVYFVNLTASPAVITQVADIQTTVIAGGLDDDAAITTAIGVDLKVSDRCQKVKIGAHIYYKSGASAYTKNTKGSGLTTPVFDSNLNFANDATKVYRWNSTSNDYDQPITALSGLKTSKTLFVNQNQNKILLFTQQANGGVFDLVAKLWTLNGNAWTEVQTIPPASTTTGAAIPFVSSDFETIGIIWEGASSTLAGTFAKANYATATLTSIPIPSQWRTSAYQLSPLPTIILGNNYLYYRSNKAGTGNVRAQITYRIDKVANRFVQLKRRDLTPQDIDALSGNRIKNIVLNENNDLLTLVYQITPASPVNTVHIIRRDMGSANVQTVVRGISGNVVVVNNMVYSCPPGCKQCNDPQNCATCQDSFVLEQSSGESTGRCLKCKANGCATCADSVVTTCVTCFAGKYKDGGNLCVNCDSSCLTCSGSGSSDCDSCRIGFYLDGGNTCLPCQADCNICSSGTACTTCRTGYVWDSTTSINGVTGNCVRCAAGCANCKPDKIFQCTNSSTVLQSCGTDKGFEPIIVNNTNTGCKICPTYCKTCANGVCSVCRDDYLLIDGKCIQKCVSPCQTCNAGFPSQCTSCIGGYIISGNSCNPDLGCNSAASCTACPIGYNLMGGICVKCQGGANCQICLSTSSTTCMSCVKGYYYNPVSQLCIACAVGCGTCNNDAACLTCASGYYFAISSDSTVTANGKCLKCDDSCLSCYKDAISCDICANGYRRNGFKCQGNNRVAFQTKYDVALTSVTNSIMVNIQKAYSTAVGLPQSSVTITSVVAGSVIVSGSITTASQSSVPTVAAALSTATAAGTTIDGLTIIGSSLTAVTTSGSYSVEDNSSYYKNVAIIVGIVIPIGIIILFIIIIVLMKKGVICVDSGNGRIRDASMDEINVNQKQSEYNTMRKK